MSSAGYSINGDGSSGQILTSNTLISSAQILALNTTPIQLIAAPGVGYSYDVLNVYGKFTKVTNPYTTNNTLQIFFDNPPMVVFMNNILLLGSTATRMYQFLRQNPSTSTAASQISENSAVKINVLTGNPTAGDGTLTIYVSYRILTL